MDIVTVEQRSRNMSAIRSKNTKPEVYYRKLLFAKGYRYVLNSRTVPGHPDIYLKKYNTAIFINGCFWHRHEGCPYAYTPKTRVEFWTKKFEANKKRDMVVKAELQKQGIKCLVVWECAINKAQKKMYSPKDLLMATIEFLQSESLYYEISSDIIVP